LDPNHVASRLLACRLTTAAEDWAGALQNAQAVLQAQPTLLDPRVCAATALENLGRVDEAKKTYQDMVTYFPNLSTGYMGMAGILERNKDYAGALQWVRRWRKLAPRDIDALKSELRLLVLSNKTDEAVKLAEGYLAEQGKEFKEALARELAKLPPPKDDKDKEQRAKEEKEAALIQESTLLLALAGGFQGGEALEQAETWAQRAKALAEKVSEPNRARVLQPVNLLLADINLTRGQGESSPVQRTAALNKAVELYRGIYESAPGDLVSGNNLAWLLDKERGEKEAALAIVQQVRLGRYSRKPISGDRLPMEFLDTLGEVYHDANQNEEAVNTFKEAMNRYPNEPRVYLHLGRSYLGLRQFRLAAENLTKAQRLANEKAAATGDPTRKAKLLAVAAAARKEQQRLPSAGNAGPAADAGNRPQ
jgi:tetratricopeptide (TPR) repeat protein